MTPRNEDSLYRELTAADLATFWNQNKKRNQGYFVLKMSTWLPKKEMLGYFFLHSPST